MQFSFEYYPSSICTKVQLVRKKTKHGVRYYCTVVQQYMGSVKTLPLYNQHKTTLVDACGIDGLSLAVAVQEKSGSSRLQIVLVTKPLRRVPCHPALRPMACPDIRLSPQLKQPRPVEL